jgi:hypothetical protein
LRTFISIVSLVALSSVSAGAQTASPLGPVPAQVGMYGNRGRTPRRDVGKTLSVDLMPGGMHSRVIREGSGFSTDQPGVGDGLPAFSPHNTFSKQSNPARTRHGFLPSAGSYGRFDKYSELSDGFDLDSSYELRDQSGLNPDDTSSYRFDAFQPLAAEQIISGRGLPVGFDRAHHPSPAGQWVAPRELDTTYARAGGLGFAETAKENRKNARRDTILLIALCLAVHGAVTWDAQSTNHFFRHHPEGFRPAEADPLLRPFAGKALMYPMANLLFAAPVDLLLFKTRHDRKPIRALVRAAALAWVGLEMQQSIVNIRNEHLKPVPATRAARVTAGTR